MSLAQAVDTALKAVPGTVEEAELDDEHGRAVWEVGVLPDRGTPRDVVVDAGDGKVTANRADRPDDDDSEPAGAVRGAKITIAHAARRGGEGRLRTRHVHGVRARARPGRLGGRRDRPERHRLRGHRGRRDRRGALQGDRSGLTRPAAGREPPRGCA
ncbi:PepSY domain-containing protein [Actinomadura madurae]|nr:PepSY domain-containing protein [Actinomadura madurae]MCQ0004064.1 PepSY domain-containing protein [Actinomadura madurae]